MSLIRCHFLLITGLLFASIGLHSQENIELPDFGDSSGAIISPAQERKLGENFVRQLRKLAPLVTDPEVEDYIQQLGRSLSDHTDYHNEFEFFVIDSNVVNAFAVPGGFVAFHTGLILRTENESELASVMGHEIVHVTQRHGARGIEAGRRMNMPAMAAMFAAIALTAIDPEAGAAAIMATQAAAQQFQINFTRSNEKEADALGIRLVAAAGYDTRKMADFFEKMQRASRFTDPGLIPEYLRTHPITVNRIAEARGRAERIRPSVIREDSYQYHLVKAKLEVRAQFDPAEAVSIFEYKLKNKDYVHREVARYGYALALSEAGHFKKAQSEISDLVQDYPTVVPFHLAAGAIESKVRKYDQAITHFRKAYTLEPENRAAVYGYVDSLLNIKSSANAKKVLSNYGLSDRRDPKYYNLLAKAESGLGDEVNSFTATAEYYLSVGEYAHAAEQLRLARRTKTLSNYQRQKIIYRLGQIEKLILEMEQDKLR